MDSNHIVEAAEQFNTLFGAQLVDPATLIPIELEIVEAPKQLQMIRSAGPVQGVFSDLLAAGDGATSSQSLYELYVFVDEHPALARACVGAEQESDDLAGKAACKAALQTNSAGSVKPSYRGRCPRDCTFATGGIWGGRRSSGDSGSATEPHITFSRRKTRQ